MKNEKSKQTNILNRISPLGNLGTNPEELHTPTSTPKKPKKDGGDMKEKLELDKMLCENKAWQEVDIVFQKLSKWKPMFFGKIVETLSVWHQLQ
jgi:hypothetical protein